jgi:subtilisin family serine protease
MKRIVSALLLFLVTFTLFSFNTQDPSVNIGTSNYFKMPSGLTETDYLANTIVFKLKENNRSQAGTDRIDNTVLNNALISLNSNKLNKIFPDAQKPEQEYASYGEKYSDLSLIYVFKYTSNVSIEDAVNLIYATGQVEYAQPKYIQHVSYNPNDPSIGSQYHISRIQAPAGWDVQKGDTNVVVGIVDSGTDWDHPDLAANVKINYNDPINGIDDDLDGYTDNYRGWDLAGADYNNVVGDNNPMIMGANNNHGSHVSGDACAVTDNSIGVAGPGFRCKFMGVKCAADNDTRGSGGSGLIITGYEGIVYAANHGCAVVNCSWGGGGGGQFEQDVITYATINKNTLVVCAAGNDNSSATFYPASYKYVLSVASTTSTDAKSSFSNFGTNIDISAPGSAIYSTVWDNSYASFSGTSMASPITAGVCAIVKSQFPSYNAIQVGEKVRVTADNINSINPGYVDQLGKGRVNMFTALTVNSPSIRLSSFTVSDGNNNVPQPGDTVSITGTFKNYLAATSAGLNITISTSSAAVTLMNGSFPAGSIPTLGTAVNTSNPFKVKVNASAPANSIVTFKINYTDGTYTDFEYFNIIVNPTYFDMNINKVTVTLNSKGNFGYNDYSSNTQGSGFKYENASSILFEGGLMCAISQTNVSDVVRGATQTTDNATRTSFKPGWKSNV